MLRLAEGLVSTIIPVYNRAELVREAIGSVLAQSYRPIEIIVVDDGSADGTAEAVQRLAQDHPEIVLLRQANTGPGRARQTGLERARGDYIQFLDSDDLLAPSKFERQVKALTEAPEAGACYGWTVRYPLGAAKSGDPVKWTAHAFETMFPSFLADRWWDTSTPLYRAGPVRANGPWLDLRQEEDWEFDCRLAAGGLRLAMVPAVVSETRVPAESRLSLGGSSDPGLLRDRCRARAAILGHAVKAGIAPADPHMRQFLDGSFLVARQAALAGLQEEAAALIRLLNDFDGDRKRRLFHALAKLTGYARFTKLAESAHGWGRARLG